MAIDVDQDQEWVTLQEAARATGKNTSALRGAIFRKKITKAKKEAGATGDYWLVHREELDRLKTDRTGAFDWTDRGRSEEANGGDRNEQTPNRIGANGGVRGRSTGPIESDRTEAFEGVRDEQTPSRIGANGGVRGRSAGANGGDRTEAIEGVRDEQTPSRIDANGGVRERTGAFEDDYETEVPGIAHVNLVTIEYYDQQREKWERERSQLEQGIMMYRYKFEEMDRQIKALPAPPEYVKAKIEELEQSLKEEAEAKELVLKELRDKLEEEERLKEEIRSEKERLSAEYEYERRRSWWKKLWGLK